MKNSGSEVNTAFNNLYDQVSALTDYILRLECSVGDSLYDRPNVDYINRLLYKYKHLKEAEDE